MTTTTPLVSLGQQLNEDIPTEYSNLNAVLSSYEEVTEKVQSLIVMSSYMGLENAKVALIAAYNEILATRPIPHC
ncbi:MAG: hypothetical protein PHD48_07765 [Alphaproteobacteria bacterium]|nr:hypothetical protein [Alphaproteobacteria bacterium]